MWRFTAALCWSRRETLNHRAEDVRCSYIFTDSLAIVHYVSSWQTRIGFYCIIPPQDPLFSRSPVLCGCLRLQGLDERAMCLHDADRAAHQRALDDFSHASETQPFVPSTEKRGCETAERTNDACASLRTGTAKPVEADRIKRGKGGWEKAGKPKRPGSSGGPFTNQNQTVAYQDRPTV